MTDLKTLTGKKEIYEAFHKMIDSFLEGAKCIKTETGNRGGLSYPVIFWREDLGVWLNFSLKYLLESRYWIAWGIANPTIHRHVKQIVQTNMRVEGYYLKLGSTFVKDSQGKIYLTHNGKIGGGCDRIGPYLFWANYQGKSETIEYSRGKTRKIVKIELSSSFPKEIARFVHEVDRIKQIGKR